MNINKEKGNPITYLPYIVTSAVLLLPALTGGLIWLYFLTPLPVFYYLLSLELDKGAQIIYRSAIIAGGLAIIAKVFPVLLFSLTLIPVGFILAHGVKKGETPYLAALKAIIFLAAIWFFSGLVINSGHQTSLYDEILINIDRGLAAAYESYKVSVEIPPASLPEIETAFTELRQLVPKIFPGTIFMTIITTVWLNLILGDWLLKKKAPHITSWENFKNWRLPDQLVWAVILGGGMLFTPSSTINIIGLNCLMVSGLIYFFQGLAVITFLMARWTVPQPIKIFLYLILVIQAYGMIILAVLGLADVWLDFRKPRPDIDKPTN